MLFGRWFSRIYCDGCTNHGGQSLPLKYMQRGHSTGEVPIHTEEPVLLGIWDGRDGLWLASVHGELTVISSSAVRLMSTEPWGCALAPTEGK